MKLLYRCLFLFYAEARGLLPSEDRHAKSTRRIRSMRSAARPVSSAGTSATIRAGYDLWQQLKGLVQAVNEGDPSYGVMGYNGGLFDDEEEVFSASIGCATIFYAQRPLLALRSLIR